MLRFRSTSSSSAARCMSSLATPLLKKNTLDRAFSECDTQQELEQVVMTSSKYDFNSWNVMTAFSRLGRLGKPVAPEVYTRLLEIERDMRRPEKGQSKFSPLELVGIATGVALGPLADKLPPFVVRDLKLSTSFDKLEANSLASLAYAFGRLSHVDFDVVGKLVSELAEQRGDLSEFSPNELSVIAQSLGWWYVAAEKQPMAKTFKNEKGIDIDLPVPSHITKRDALFSKVSAALVQHGDKATPMQLANALNGFVRVGYSGEELFDLVAARQNLEEATPKEITNLVHAFAVKRANKATQFLDKLAPVISAKHAKFTPKQVNLLLASFAELKWTANKQVVDVLVREISRRGLAEHMDQAVLAESLAQLK